MGQVNFLPSHHCSQHPAVMLEEGWELCSTCLRAQRGRGGSGQGSTGRRIAAWQSSPCSYNEVVCSLGRCVRGGGRREHRGIAKKGNVKQRAEVKHS